jgi:hypothetical protein
VYLTLSAQSRAVAETTTKVVTRLRPQIDTLNVTDTIEVIRFLRAVDTVLVRCDECARQLAKHRAFTDSAMKVKDDSIAKLNARLEACRGSRKWWAVTGFAGGVATCGR